MIKFGCLPWLCSILVLMFCLVACICFDLYSFLHDVPCFKLNSLESLIVVVGPEPYSNGHCESGIVVLIFCISFS